MVNPNGGNLGRDTNFRTRPIPVRQTNFTFMAAFEVQRPIVSSYAETDVRPYSTFRNAVGRTAIACFPRSRIEDRECQSLVVREHALPTSCRWSRFDASVEQLIERGRHLKLSRPNSLWREGYVLVNTLPRRACHHEGTPGTSSTISACRFVRRPQTRQVDAATCKPKDRTLR